MNTKPDQYMLARSLYFNTDLTQSEIAKQIGINKNTISLWINRDNWRQLKAAMLRMPSMIIEHFYAQIEEMNFEIRSRFPDSRFASCQEAEALKKLIWCIIKLRQDSSLGNNMENITDFCQYIADSQPELAGKINDCATAYLNDKLKKTYIPTELDYYTKKEIEEYDNQEDENTKEQENTEEQEVSEYPKYNKKEFCKNNDFLIFPDPPLIR